MDQAASQGQRERELEQVGALPELGKRAVEARAEAGYVASVVIPYLRISR